MLTGQLKYIEETHKYFIGDIEVPGVTSIIDGAGFVSEFAKQDETARTFGTIFHKTMNLVGRGKLLSVDTAFKENGWLAGIEKFFKEQQPTPFCNDPNRAYERILFSQRFGFAGTIDFVGLLKDFGNTLCIPDWKTCSSITKESKKAYEMQTSAYEVLFKEYESYTGKIKRLVVKFEPWDYNIIPLNDTRAQTAFLSCLNVHKYKVAA